MDASRLGDARPAPLELDALYDRAAEVDPSTRQVDPGVGEISEVDIHVALQRGDRITTQTETTGEATGQDNGSGARPLDVAGQAQRA